MNHEQQIDNEQFGQMINLPTILNENRASTSNASLAVSKLLDSFKIINVLEAPINELDSMDARLQELQLKLSNTIKRQEEKRKPYTGFFDKVRALFTAEEKAVGALSQQIEDSRKLIAARKLSDQRKADAEKQKAVDKKNEEIRIRTLIKDQFHAFYNNWAFKTKEGFRDWFYKKTESELKEIRFGFEVPVFNTWMMYRPDGFSILTDKELFDFQKEEVDKLSFEEYSNSVNEYTASLRQLIPSRIIELQKIATDKEVAEKSKQRQEEERQQLEAQRDQTTANNKQLHQADATAQQLEATFDIVAAAPVIEQSKGVKIKKNYKADTHSAHIAIMQWWTANVLPTISIEDLNTKLSFMRTAADKSLNDGEGILVANGLTIIDDIKTRTR